MSIDFGDVRSAYHNGQRLPQGWRTSQEAVEYLTPDAGTLRLIMPDIFTGQLIEHPIVLEGQIKGKRVVYEQRDRVDSWQFFHALVGQIMDLKDHARPSHRMTNLGVQLSYDDNNPVLSDALYALHGDAVGRPRAWRAEQYITIARHAPDPVIAILAWLSARACQRMSPEGFSPYDRLAQARYLSVPGAPMFHKPDSAYHRIPVGLRHLPRKMTIQEEIGKQHNKPVQEALLWSYQQDPVGHSVADLITDYLIAALQHATSCTLPDAWVNQCALEVYHDELR